MKLLVVVMLLFGSKMASASIFGLWKGASLVYKNGEYRVCQTSLYLKDKEFNIETLTTVICRDEDIPLRLMSQSFIVDNNKIVHEHIKGYMDTSKLHAKAKYSKHHNIKVDMKVKDNILMYDFLESVHKDFSLIRGTLIKQDL